MVTGTIRGVTGGGTVGLWGLFKRSIVIVTGLIGVIGRFPAPRPTPPEEFWEVGSGVLRTSPVGSSPKFILPEGKAGCPKVWSPCRPCNRRLMA